MRLYTSAPHPFVLAPEYREGDRLEEGSEFGFTLTLIGNGTTYLPYLIHTFQTMGDRGRALGAVPFSLESVETEDETGALSPSWRRESGEGVVNLPIPLSSLVHPPDGNTGLAIEFLTPFRVKHADSLQSHADFGLIVSSLLRRLTNLLAFHTTTELQLDFREIVAEAHAIPMVHEHVRFTDWSRFSNRQQTEMHLGGIEGIAEYPAPAGAFLPLLSLGHWLHIGKGTGFGLGRILARATEVGVVQSAPES